MTEAQRDQRAGSITSYGSQTIQPHGADFWHSLFSIEDDDESDQSDTMSTSDDDDAAPTIPVMSAPQLQSERKAMESSDDSEPRWCGVVEV